MRNLERHRKNLEALKPSPKPTPRPDALEHLQRNYTSSHSSASDTAEHQNNNEVKVKGQRRIPSMSLLPRNSSLLDNKSTNLPCKITSLHSCLRAPPPRAKVPTPSFPPSIWSKLAEGRSNGFARSSSRKKDSLMSTADKFSACLTWTQERSKMTKKYLVLFDELSSLKLLFKSLLTTLPSLVCLV